MPRYFIQIAYKGSAFHGWQLQPNAYTVQECIEDGIAKVCREKVRVTGAGRTDTGVHAQRMFAHFDMERAIDEPEKIVFRLNSFFPRELAIHRIIPVGDRAHARFDALSRTYEYRIITRKEPFLMDTAWYLYGPKPDINRMNQAAEKMLEYDDFETFSKSGSGTGHFLCRIDEARWEEEGHLLKFTIRANRFLRNMVRAVVGTLVEVGQEKREVDDMHGLIESRDRRRAGSSAPPQGLCLTDVEYPNTLFNG